MLQLVDDPIATLNEAARIVRPGGRVIAILSNSEFDPADEIATIIDGLAPLRAERLGRNRIVEANLAGLALEHQGYTPWDGFASTVADEIDHIENRVYSSLFDVDDATWSAVVDPVLEQLRAIPEPDRPSRAPQSPSLARLDLTSPVVSRHPTAAMQCEALTTTDVEVRW